MQIGGLQKLSLIDYPGKLACTVFTIGCNFRCPFCYSGELVLPEKTKYQEITSEKEFFDFLIERQGLLEGCVLCGGEPTINKDLPDFLKKIKKLGFLIKIDTNGSNPEILKKLIKDNLIDYIALDIKAPKEKYEFYSSSKLLESVEKSIALLKKNKVAYEFRTTIAPGLNRYDFLAISNWIGEDPSKKLEKKSNYYLQEFYSEKEIIEPKMLMFPVLKREEVKEVVKEIKPRFRICQIR